MTASKKEQQERLREAAKKSDIKIISTGPPRDDIKIDTKVKTEEK